MDPTVTLDQAVAFFKQMLHELDGVHQRLPDGTERTQVGELLKGIQGPMDAMAQAGRDAQAEIGAMQQQGQERLKAVATRLPAGAPAVEAEAGATLGPRLRAEVLERYARPKPPPAPAPVTEDDRLTDNVGSVASQWAWDSEPITPPTPPGPTPPGPPPESPSRTQTTKAKDEKGKADPDLWDDLSKAEE